MPLFPRPTGSVIDGLPRRDTWKLDEFLDDVADALTELSTKVEQLQADLSANTTNDAAHISDSPEAPIGG